MKLIGHIKEVSERLDVIKKGQKAISDKVSELEELQNSLISQLVEKNGWSAIEIDGNKFLPGQDHNGRFTLRRL